MMTAESISPAVSPETAVYWAAAQEGRLLLKHCLSCKKPHFYPRNHCPHCFSPDTDWVQSDGNGTIYSFTVMRRANPQYAVAYVTLDEGVTMFSNIVGCDVDGLSIGQRVRVEFQSCGERRIPVFTLHNSGVE